MTTKSKTAPKKPSKGKKKGETIDIGGGFTAEIVEAPKPLTKKEKFEAAKKAAAEKVAKMAANNGKYNKPEKQKPTLVPLSEQLTPEEEDAKARAEKKRDKGKPEKPAPIARVKKAMPDGVALTPKGRVPDKLRGMKTTKADGVLATILDQLCNATEKKPVTKREIFDVLVKKFPERNPSSMMSTVNHQVPTYLNYAGHSIRKVEGGYWGTRAE